MKIRTLMMIVWFVVFLGGAGLATSSWGNYGNLTSIGNSGAVPTPTPIGGATPTPTPVPTTPPTTPTPTPTKAPTATTLELAQAADNPVAQYYLNDSVGSAKAHDYSGNANDLTIGTGATLHTASVETNLSGNSVTLPGGAINTQNRLIGPALDTIVQPTAEVAVEAYFTITAYPSGAVEAIVSDGDELQAVNEPYSMTVDASGHLNCNFNINGTFVQQVSNALIPLNAPAEGTCEYDGSGTFLWVNGVLEVGGSHTGPVAGYDATHGLTIGSRWGTSAGQISFGGKVQDVVVYGAPAPNDTRIRAHWSASGGSFPTPAPAPSGQPSLSNGGFVNGAAAPMGSFLGTWVPGSLSSAWNTPVCNVNNGFCASTPPFLSNSSAVLNYGEFSGGQTNTNVRNWEAGPSDNGEAIYFATSTDPLVNVSCQQQCNGSAPAQVHVPAKMRFPGCMQNICSGYYSDAPTAVIQPDGTEIDFAYANTNIGRDWQTGDSISANAAAITCGNIYTGTGFVTGSFGGSSAAGRCVAYGYSGPQQAQAAANAHTSVGHALAMTASCAGSTGDGTTEQPSVYPAFPNTFTSVCADHNVNASVPMGAHLWYDVPCSTTYADAGLHWEEQVTLCTLHDYGAYFTDDGPDGAAPPNMGYMAFSTFADSGAASYQFGVPTSAGPYASLGWDDLGPVVSGDVQHRYSMPYHNAGNNWTPNSTSNGNNFIGHLHFLQTCSAHGTC